MCCCGSAGPSLTPTASSVSFWLLSVEKRLKVVGPPGIQRDAITAETLTARKANSNLACMLQGHAQDQILVMRVYLLDGQCSVAMFKLEEFVLVSCFLVHYILQGCLW